METPIQVDLGRIAQDLQIRRVQVESVVQLLDEGNTVPFITRYRKERTGNLNEVAVHEIQLRVGRLRELAERKETILKAIEAQGKLTDELASAIRAADNSKRLEDLYLPYKPKKKTKASDARERGLEPLALRIWNRDETLADLNGAAQEFLNPEKELDTIEKVLEGVGHILAEAISEMANVRDAVRRVVWRTGKIVTTKAEIPEGEGLEYRDYFNYSEPVGHIPPHRVLAINRGDKEGPLKVKLEVSRPELEGALLGQLPLEGHPQSEIFRSASIDALDRLLLPSLEREVRRDLTEMAERHAVDVFARNLRSLLLQPPITKQVVLAIDPGFRTGCKVAVLDPHGNLLEHGVIHPHAPQNRRSESKLFLKDLVGKHSVGVVAIGNGTACRETEELIAEIIAEGVQFSQNPEAAQHVAETKPAEAEANANPPAATESVEPPTEAAPAPAESEAPPVAAASVEEHAAELTPESLPPVSGGSPEEEEGTALETDEPPASDGTSEASASAPEASESESASAVNPESAPESPAIETPAAESAPADAAPPEAVAETAPAPETPAETPAPAPSPAAAGKPAKSGGKSDQPKPPRPKQPPAPPKPHPADTLLAQMAYVIVNEAGASVYSTSPVGREEFPDFDPTLRGTISIGRRLQDPLSELVKIEPQNIGVGLYQHDVNAKQLKESLESVISSCVNFVGVDLDTASVPLLRHVSGLNQLTARRIVEHRKEKGPFQNREELMQVEGVGPATYTQAAGFLKLRDSSSPFDRTWIHPESYGVATKLLEKLGFPPEIVKDKEQLPALHAKLNEADLPALARELEVGEPTLRDIFDALARPDRDPRDDLPKPIFKKGVLKLEDLQAGMELKGTVLNVVDFGAFVDIGLKDSGLVHISQLANRYIKSPHDVVSVGDVVTAWVMGVDHERKRVSLTMVKPGTERPRGGPQQQQGGGRRGGGEGQQPQRGGERKGGGPRPPRREPAPPSQLTSQPVGGPPVTSTAGNEPPRGRADQRPSGPPRHEGGGGRPGGPGGPGRGGRPQSSGGHGHGRPTERPQTPRPPSRPSKPSPPPPPLSKDALAGSVPLRTFGQLKQLWQARESDAETPEQPQENASPAPSSPEAPPAAPPEAAPSEPASEG